jgi:ligand-binding sensor domain-containing protein
MPRLGSGLVPLLATVLAAERLPVRVYSTTDGLSGISIHKIVSDSHGFLWFCTGEGLSRFDGYQFTNFGIADGLPEPNVYDLLETREGVYWVATAAGLSRFDPRAGVAPRFQVYRPASQSAAWINGLAEENKDGIWAGTPAGLFLFRRSPGTQDWSFEPIEFGSPDRAPNDRRVSALLRDRQGYLWIGAGSGLYLRRANGHTQRYSTAQGLPSNFVTSLTEDSEGTIWVGTDEGLCRLTGNPRAQERLVSRRYTVADGLPADLVKAVIQVSGKRLWIGTRSGLAELVDTSVDAVKPIRTLKSAPGCAMVTF